MPIGWKMLGQQQAPPWRCGQSQGANENVIKEFVLG